MLVSLNFLNKFRDSHFSISITLTVMGSTVVFGGNSIAFESTSHDADPNPSDAIAEERDKANSYSLIAFKSFLLQSR